MKRNPAEIMLWVVTIAAIVMLMRVRPIYAVGLALALAIYYALQSIRRR